MSANLYRRLASELTEMEAPAFRFKRKRTGSRRAGLWALQASASAMLETALAIPWARNKTTLIQTIPEPTLFLVGAEGASRGKVLEPPLVLCARARHS